MKKVKKGSSGGDFSLWLPDLIGESFGEILGDDVKSDEIDLKSTLNEIADLFDVHAAREKLAGSSTADIWEFDPPDTYTFCTDEFWLNLGQDIYPVVMQDLKDAFPTDPRELKPKYEEIIFDEAIGSGKSFKLSILATYMAAKLLCLRNPQRTFKLAPGSKLAIMNMSVSASQARRVVFGEIKNKIDNSIFFKTHYPPNPRIKSELQFDPSPDNIKKATKSIYKNVYIIPGSSSGMAPLGYNLFCGIIDEATLWRDTENKDYVEDVYNIIRRRVTSRFMDKGLIVLGGSPMYSTDFLERRIKAVHEEELTNVMFRRRAHWHAKYPDYKGPEFYFHVEDSKVFKDEAALEKEREKVAKKAGDKWKQALENFDKQIAKIPMMYYEDFRKNPEGSKRDLGGWPSDSISSFVENPSVILDNIDERREDPVRSPYSFKKWFGPLGKFWHTLHIDLGLTGDACGIAMGHPEGWTPEGGVQVFIDFVMRIQGSNEEPVQIEDIRKLIYKLTEMGFYIGKITMDGFQSADTMQILAKRGYFTEYLSLDRSLEPYEEWKTALYENRINMYPHEIYQKEAQKLEKIKNRKIDHPRGGSKDCTDAVAGVVFNCIDLAKWDPPTDDEDAETVIRL